MSRQIIRRPAADILAAFPGSVAVDLDGLACASRFAIVTPGESGYTPIHVDPEADAVSLDYLDLILIRQGRATRAPTPAEREAAVCGSMFGWDTPGADPLNHERD